MVSVPQVGIGSAAGWSEARLPSTANQGATSMLQARAMRDISDLRQIEVAKGKKEAKDEEAIKGYRQMFVDAYKANDRQGMARNINDIAVINPDAAKSLKDTFFNLDRTDAAMAAMHMYAAAASDTEEAQNASLDKAFDLLAMSSFPLAENVKEMRNMPFGAERDKAMLDSVAVAQAMGLLPSPKDVFGTAGAGALGAQGMHTTHFFDDGSAVGITKDGKSLFFDPQGRILTGAARKAAIEKAKFAGVDIEAMKKEAVKTAETRVKNYNALVDTGKAAMDNLPDVLRTLSLLQEVDTGGWEGVKLRIKNFLGVEEDDEAVLSNLLATNVLKQLRPTFGPQFTKQEGDWLKSIEANIGKSTEGNIAIMKKIFEKYKFYIDRTLKEAESRDIPDKDVINYLTYGYERIDKEFPAAGPSPEVEAKTPAAPVVGGEPMGGQPMIPSAPGQAATVPDVPMPGKGRPLPPMEKGTTARDNELNILRRAEEEAWKYGIMPEALLYNRRTGEYGYKDENGKFVPLRVPTP